MISATLKRGRPSRPSRSSCPSRPSSAFLSRQLPVLDPMWLIGLGAETTFAIRLVVLVIAFEPDDRAVALECEHVSRDAIEEPAIVADHDRAAREVQQRLFERAQRVDV